MLLSGRGLHGRCLKRLWRSGMAAIVAWPARGSPPGAHQAWAAWLRFWGRAVIPSVASHRRDRAVREARRSSGSGA